MPNISDLQTPAVIIKKSQLDDNIILMNSIAKTLGLNLRPMIKTHKSIDIAKKQIEQGAIGILVATPYEAKVMAAAGIKDITLAYPVIPNSVTLASLIHYAQTIRVTLSVDAIDQVEKLDSSLNELNFMGMVDTLIIIDSGLKRLGVLPNQVIPIAESISKSKHLRLKGVATHGGYVYAAQNKQQVIEAAKQEIDSVALAAKILRNHDYNLDTVAIGTTPTSYVLEETDISEITEIRPGNYVFHDLNQVNLGIATEDQCSLRILTTVLSRPTSDRAVIDAGTKSLGLDKGAHTQNSLPGFGRVVGHPDIVIERLSEELAVLKVPRDSPIKFGDTLEIIPNHACTVANLFDRLWLYDDNRQILSSIPVSARR